MSESSADYRVELDAYSGPLDLLLYLIRREEVDIFNIPVGQVTEQYLRYMDILSELNINVAGEFVVMAATLIEIKSRMMTPEPEAMPEEEPDDPRMELVRQLMAYKRFKEAALALTERADAQSERFARPGERPPGADPVEAPSGVSIWALLEAFSKVLEQTGARRPHRLVMDNVPQEVIKAELEERLRVAGQIGFFKIFEGQATRIRIVGTFLALLELVKQQVLRAEQEETFGDIVIKYVPPEERQAVEPESAAVAQPAEGTEGPPDGALTDADEDYENWPEDVSEIKLPDVPDVDAAPAAEGQETPDGDEDEYDDEEEDEDDEDEDDEDE